MKALLLTVVLVLLTGLTWAADWSFTINGDDTGVADDAELRSSDADGNYGTAALLWFGANYRIVYLYFAFPGLSDTLALSAYGGTLDSLRVWWRTGGELINAGETLFVWVEACKRTVVEAEVTWNSYSTGNAWQTAGALGANDTYQGSASDTTIIVDGFPTAADSIGFKIDTTGYSNESWILFFDTPGGTPQCPLRASDDASNPGPRLKAFGHTAAAGGTTLPIEKQSVSGAKLIQSASGASAIHEP